MYGVNCVCTWPWAYRTYYSYLLSNSLHILQYWSKGHLLFSKGLLRSFKMVNGGFQVSTSYVTALKKAKCTLNFGCDCVLNYIFLFLHRITIFSVFQLLDSQSNMKCNYGNCSKADESVYLTLIRLF